MKENTVRNYDKNKIWISITGYRTLLFLIKILEKPRSVNELLEIVQNDEITKKSASVDTIRITINTLKSMGCKFTRPTKSNDYKYGIITHPFNFNLTQEDIEALILIRERLSYELGFKKVLILNNFFDKLISLTKNDNYKKIIEDTKPLNTVNPDVLNTLSKSGIIGKKINITYNSPQFAIENIDVVPQKLIYENAKLYLWCYSYKYGKNILLNTDRINKINTMGTENIEITTDFYEVEYEVFGAAAANFRLEKDEEYIQKEVETIIVKAKVSNEFWFIQRLLLFGSEFKIISPDFFREKLIDKIKLIRKGYTK